MTGDLTTNEAAQLIGVHPNTLRRWVADGIIPYYRTPGGRNIRFRREDLEEVRRTTEGKEAS